MATITLVYRMESNLLNQANAIAAMRDANLFEGELDLLSMSVDSDSTAIVAGTTQVQRVIVLLTDATSDANFPTDADKIAATVNLYGGVLAAQIPASVQAGIPEVAP